MNELNNKEDLTHYNEIIAEFDSINMPAKQRKAIMTAIQALITEQVRLGREDAFSSVLNYSLGNPTQKELETYVLRQVKSDTTLLEKEK